MAFLLYKQVFCLIRIIFTTLRHCGYLVFIRNNFHLTFVTETENCRKDFACHVRPGRKNESALTNNTIRIIIFFRDILKIL